MSNAIICRFNKKSFSLSLPIPDNNYFISPWVEFIFFDSITRLELMTVLDLLNSYYHFKLFADTNNYKLVIFANQLSELVTLIELLHNFVVTNSDRRKLKKQMKKLLQAHAVVPRKNHILVKLKYFFSKCITIFNLKPKIAIL